MKILLIGMMGLYNRGCEAIVWGTNQILKSVFPNVEVFAAVGYSDSAKCDKDRLMNLDVGIYPFRKRQNMGERLLEKVSSQLTGTSGLIVPRWSFPNDNWDYIFEVGGDTFVGRDVRYRLKWDASIRKRYRSKLALWGMNIGPYMPEDIRNKDLLRALSQYAFIAVRDDFSFHYLRELDVQTRMFRMIDPAFFMSSEVWSLEKIFPENVWSRTIGLNFSPFVSLMRRCDEAETIRLTLQIVEALCDRGYAVLLVPHCFPPACPDFDNDKRILQFVFTSLKKKSREVGILPEGLNSPQVKFAISKCHLFAGARMHSTIAAWSSGVPALTLSYSQKSLNLSEELYGCRDYIVDITKAMPDEIVSKLIAMSSERSRIAELLSAGLKRYFTIDEDFRKNLRILNG